MGPIDYLVHNLMMPFLNFSYTHIWANYGIAIILLTILIKIAFFPLTQKQYQSMKAMQAVQPKVKKIQEKYKKDPKKMQEEMVKFYKENKINPFGGCLPLLIQLPFFFAIFYTVNSEVFKEALSVPGVNKGLFSFWLADLTTKDSTLILPIAIAALTYWTQKLSITDEKQARMMAFMPFFMLAICLTMPSGVLLYWAASQLLSAVQQYYVTKQ